MPNQPRFVVMPCTPESKPGHAIIDSEIAMQPGKSAELFYLADAVLWGNLTLSKQRPFVVFDRVTGFYVPIGTLARILMEN